ncbi:hypothetical protein ACS0TY_020883 [Phlomoides rotata]
MQQNMAQINPFLLKNLSLILVLILVLQQTLEADLKTQVFLSPKFVLEPGLVSNKYYYQIDFPRGHIALKSFNAEIVDETGKSIPLHETYIHHWILLRYHAPKNTPDVRKNHTTINNSGLCDTSLPQYFGLGAETRRTATDIPDPYGIEVGDPTRISDGYEEGWVLNVHAIDTRGAVDRMGCAECRCDLYNVTADEDGEALPSGYNGGIRCCRDETRCKVRQGFVGEKRRLYMRYTVKYVDWDSTAIVPVKVYILDVTDVWTIGDQSRGIRARHDCVVEYDIESCGGEGLDKNGCIHSKSLRVSLPSGGDVIYAVGHQHAGATATVLYGQGERVICASYPIYGKGDEAGNEAGYIVGMSTCYPSPARPVKISAGETLTLVSNYSSVESHAGVMGLFYLLLAESLSPSPNSLQSAKADIITTMPNFVWQILLLGVALTAIVTVVLKGRSGRGKEGYEAVV